METPQVELTEPGVVLTTAVFDAPRERVFDAWIHAPTLARWWGPNGFTNLFEQHEPKPGGQWRFVMRGPDGKEFKNHCVYREVSPPERLVLEHVNGPAYLATVTFEDLGGKTRVHWLTKFENEKFLASNQALILTSNRENLERLGALL
ncbi:SRPBCC domain-containing protein [Myxococcus sp. K15C18031901]|uniref:SRPBCC domain-containing protein n=1 Tax=Myxococcus dinghuensis TaxID=2906761 RepID=UPI0020A75102|nr:SRPBCC domain-containing protein [Myxococcus dinghuensis]MCP3097874.1 SRPBCC domain-containing protein [Myxococcus dinghuensis]